MCRKRNPLRWACATMPRNTGGRLHLVLIPGFAGFDALGQLEYYTGVTPLFREWQRRRRGQAHVVLHYFDNFPTAAVVTRAGRLRSYLAKRIARGEFLPGDTLALVGHSTGGLDIRWLLRELGRDPERTIPVEGGQGSASPVKAKEILNLVRRVVFLSVPQWGTNIADWVRAHPIARIAVVGELSAAVGASQLPLVDAIESGVAKGASYLTGLDLVRALQDSLSEADAGRCKRDPVCVADAQEAASELGLWLRHITSDFRAIDDLASRPPHGTAASPAHFSSQMREEEIGLWPKRIKRRSYATLGRRPFRFTARGTAPLWDLSKPWTYPECTEASGSNAGTDIVYRICYRACAGGPFDRRSGARMPKCLNPSQQRQIETLTKGDRIELWDNDGIVNTASMLWPDGEKTVLVPGDHMDIVGHYELVPTASGSGRQYQAYDLLKSASGFDKDSFQQVWNDIFHFCATP